MKGLVNSSLVVQPHHGKKLRQRSSVSDRRRVPPECSGSEQLRFIHAKIGAGEYPDLVDLTVVAFHVVLVVLDKLAIIEIQLTGICGVSQRLPAGFVQKIVVLLTGHKFAVVAGEQLAIVLCFEKLEVDNAISHLPKMKYEPTSKDTRIPPAEQFVDSSVTL